MVQFTDKAPYIKQIVLYFQSKNYQKAYELSKEFIEEYPEQMPAHFLYAKAAFWLNDYELAKKEAQIAFNLSKGQDELTVTGILLACALYRLKEYESGMELLKLLKSKIASQEKLMKLKFIFALALNDEHAALRHLDELYEMNEAEAKALMLKLVSSN